MRYSPNHAHPDHKQAPPYRSPDGFTVSLTIAMNPAMEAEAQRCGVVVDLTGGPMALLAVVRRLSGATVLVYPSAGSPVILDNQAGRHAVSPPALASKRTCAPPTSALRPPAASRVRLVGR